MNTKPHYLLLDALRGVAALLVVCYHVFEGFAFAQVQNGAGDGLITTLNHGYLAVDFFFMLSGFVISYAYDDRWSSLTMGNFFKRRLIRLHPMVVFGALLGALTFVLGGRLQWSGEVTSWAWVLGATLLGLFLLPAVPGTGFDVRGNGEMYSLNGPSWSLFFEYIGNFLYALFIRRFNTRQLRVWVSCLAGIWAWYCLTDVSGYGCMGVGWTLDGVNFGGGLIRMLFPFSMGMLISRTFRPIACRGALAWTSLALVLLFAVPYLSGGGVSSYNGLYELFCVMLVFPLLVQLGASNEPKQPRMERLARFLGDLSYPLYVVHYPLMYLLYAWMIRRGSYDLASGWVWSLVTVFASILVASLALKWFDRPIRKFFGQKNA